MFFVHARREAERAKRSLSTQTQVRVELESLLPGVDLSETITRAKFEELCADLFRQTLLPVEQVLADAMMTKGDVDEVVHTPPLNTPPTPPYTPPLPPP